MLNRRTHRPAQGVRERGNLMELSSIYTLPSCMELIVSVNIGFTVSKSWLDLIAWGYPLFESQLGEKKEEGEEKGAPQLVANTPLLSLLTYKVAALVCTRSSAWNHILCFPRKCLKALSWRHPPLRFGHQAVKSQRPLGSEGWSPNV